MLPLLRNLRPGLPVLAVLVAITALSCGSSSQNTPTPSGTATSVVEQSPTAEATASPTQEPTNGPSPTPQVTPTRSPTATPAPPTTTPEPTMEPTPVSTPQPEPGVIFTVENGSLPLRPGAVAPTQFNSGVSAVDFRAAATFFNPFHPVSPWNYGFKFRDASGKYQVIVIDHDGVLSYLTGQDNQLELVSSVTISGLHTTADDSNRIGLMVLGDTAWVFLNGNMVQAFHIGAVSVSGGISLITDIYHETSIQNASVRFNNFTINRAALIYSSDSGTLRKPSPTDIAVGDASPPTSAGYVKVTLVSPIAAFSGDYSYGILFRSRDGSADNWLVFDDSKKWQHIRRDADGKEKVLAQGTSSSLKTGHHDENTIEIVSTEDRQLVYVNGNLEITLMLPVDDRPFVVSPFAGFLPSQQPVEMVTDYRDFEVWSTLD